MTNFLQFKELHYQINPLIIGNVWNVQSAKVYEKLNFKALGTSSAAIANSLGYEDGEQMPFSDLLFIVERILKNIKLPLTVDIEFGYGKNALEIAQNIITLNKIGVVGINIEDSFIENGTRKLKDYLQFSELLKELRRILNKNKIELFINVRCDAFLLNIENAIQVAAERIIKYENSGADGIFLPCIVDEKDILKIISLLNIPLNVMCMPNLPNFEKLEQLGVKRISMGNYFNNHIYTELENKTSKVLNEQSFTTLF